MKSRAIRTAVVVGAFVIGLLGFIADTGALEINGLIGGASAGAFSIGDLQGLGAASQTLGGDVFTGVPLWSLLGGTGAGASNIITQGGGNNPILRNFIIATGLDGRQSLLSAGEINPLFGGTGPLYLVAYQQNGATLAAPVLVVPQDATRTRFVFGLDELSIGAVPRPPAAPRVPTTEFTLTGVTNPATYDLAALQAQPKSIAANVTFLSGMTVNGPHDYGGVALWSLLVAAGIPGDVLTSYLLATGSDGFQVLFSLAELNPAFGAPQRLVAYEVDGAPLAANDGFARLVIPGDLRGGRYVSNIESLEIAPTPEPATVLLLGTSLAGLTAAAWRRRRGSREA